LCRGLQKRIFSTPECVLAVQSRSGSSKFDDFGTNRKRVFVLLVRHCDYGPILHPFRDTVTYWLKLSIFATPLSFGALAPPMFPLEFALKLTVRKLESWDYPAMKTAWS